MATCLCNAKCNEETEASSRSNPRTRAEVCTARGSHTDGRVDGKPVGCFTAEWPHRWKPTPRGWGAETALWPAYGGAGFPSGFLANTIHVKPHGNIPVSLCS